MAIPQSSDNVFIIANASGPRGLSGWSPVLSYQDGPDGLGLYVIDWFGGTGVKPAVGQFVGAINVTVTVYTPISQPAYPTSGALQYFDIDANVMRILYSNGTYVDIAP